MNCASSLRSFQPAARSLYRSAAQQNKFYKNDFSFMPQAPEFIEIDETLPVQSQVKFTDDTPNREVWKMSTQQEQEINDSIRGYAKRQAQLAQERAIADKKQADRMNVLKIERDIIAEETDQLVQKEHARFEREQMQGVAAYLGVPLVNLLLIIGVISVMK